MSGAWLNCVIFSLRVSFTRYSQQDVLLTHPNKFPFLQAKGVISTAPVGWFSRALTCFARSNIHIKNYSAIARRKNIPFYPARTGINLSHFQLARRSFRFPSQLFSQCFFFPASSNSPWRASILSSGSVGYSCKFASYRRGVWDSRGSWPLRDWRARLDSWVIKTRTRRAWKRFWLVCFSRLQELFLLELISCWVELPKGWTNVVYSSVKICELPKY